MLDEVASLQKTLAKIRLFGPRSREDLVTLFAVQNGMVQVPDGALHRPEKWWKDENMSISAEYQRGLLNLKKVAQVVMPEKNQVARHDPLNFQATDYSNQAGFRLPYSKDEPAAGILDLFGLNRGKPAFSPVGGQRSTINFPGFSNMS